MEEFAAIGFKKASWLQEGMHLGDGVHPNWAGGRKMAEAMMAKWFQ